MTLSSPTLRPEERITLTLRELYEQYGYRPFAMNRMEEYAFYVENVNFVGSNRIAVFSDLDGRLMALKPDVTLSIVKSVPAEGVGLEKLYYAENVFRAPAGAREFRELKQMGLECVGEVTPYTLAEAVGLAARSLGTIEQDYSLSVSHLDFVGALLDDVGARSQRERLAGCIRRKNPHELLCVAEEAGVSPANAERLLPLVALADDFTDTLAAARRVAAGQAMQTALDELASLYDALGDPRVRLDFSVMPDFQYYNGVAFAGYLPKAAAAVLRGGQYDKLLRRMGKKRRAVGFALYFDALEPYCRLAPRADMDVFVWMDEQSDPAACYRAVETLTAEGLSVLADTVRPQGVGFGRVVDMRGGKVC